MVIKRFFQVISCLACCKFIFHKSKELIID